MGSILFKIHYSTRWGEDLFLEFLAPNPGKDKQDRVLAPMHCEAGGYWSLPIAEREPGSFIEYRYVCRVQGGESRREPLFRKLKVGDGLQTVLDYWLPSESPDGAFLRQAFAGIIFNPSRTRISPVEPGKTRRFRLTMRASRVLPGQRLCVSGSHPLLGNWHPARACVMSGENYPVWNVDFPADWFCEPFEFKFGLWDDKLNKLVEFEGGTNRWFGGTRSGDDHVILNCEQYEHQSLWRGGGVAIPVFSIRTTQGYGIGEFSDLAVFAEWASRCNLHLVQLLPVNDTSSDFTWKDSYPYKAISIAALHPIYLNIQKLYQDYGQPVPKSYEQRREVLNRLPELDYERVLREKLEYMRELYGRVAGSVMADGDFLQYLRDEGSWLRPYAVFCELRDQYGTADFTCWGKHASYSEEEINGWFESPGSEHAPAKFYCWLQYHLDRQLREALAAGHTLGVAFKGDLPIGIDRASVEAWQEPELFRMDRQTGAPPDAFAVLGQNWGFPTYNWGRMEADGYAWWRRRFGRMAQAFDALRIDHILGFFRIWEIPQRYREGILGHYNPALPLSPEEIRKGGFARNPADYTDGAIAESALPEFFGQDAAKVKTTVLVRGEDGLFRLRPEYNKTESRQVWYAQDSVDSLTVEGGVVRLSYEVFFVEDPDQPGRFHPRINLAQTELFKVMDPSEQMALQTLHDDFYYRRHTAFWASAAMAKLPVLMDASDMLLCGEDLGMVPESVPIVMRRLGLLSLEVQRWPKEMGKSFGVPAEYPYLSVCTTSTHDMSTIRGWWEEEVAAREAFYKQEMGQTGSAPAECSVEICRFIVRQNLASNSMWCILPLQDWLSIDGRLRHPVAAAERINIPAIPRHYWRYRMHLTVEDLLRAEDFNRHVRELVEGSGRAK